MTIRLSSLSKSFGSDLVLDDLSLGIEDGSFVALAGPSGCGKSTLLRLIAGLDRPTEGNIEVTSAGISVVFQEPRLLPWRNARANVELALELNGEPLTKAERQERSEAALENVGLKDAVRKFPDELSGGMKMRVALARALVTAPTLLLFDEPFGALDEITRQSLNDELLRLWDERKFTSVFVTHNIYEAVYVSQRVLVMSRNPGRIHADFQNPITYPRSSHTRTSQNFSAVVDALMNQMEAVCQ